MPGLPRQLVTLPFLEGVDDSVSKYIKPPGKLEEASNVRAPDTGSLGTRWGFTRINRTIAVGGANIDVNGPIRAIGSTKTELLAVGHRNLFAFIPALGQWEDRGAVSPTVGSWRAMFRGFPQYNSGDLAFSEPYVLYSALRFERQIGGTDQYEVEFRGMTVDGETIFDPLRVRINTTSDHPWGPRCCKTSAGVVFIFIEGVLSAGGGDLFRYEWKAATPAVAPVVTGTPTLTATGWVGPTPPSYDIISMGDGGYLVAWIDGVTRDVEIRRFNAAHVQQATTTIVGDFDCGVALADGSGTDFYLITLNSGDTGSIVAYSRVRSTLAASWGPLTLGAKTLTGVVSELGLVEGNNGSADRVAYTWLHRDGTGPTAEVHSRSSALDSTGLDTDTVTQNAESCVRPFWYRNRNYQHMLTSPAPAASGNQFTAGFQTHMLVDMGYSASRLPPRVAALHGFGEATPPRFQTGVMSHVVVRNTTEHRYMAPYLGEKLRNQSDERRAEDEITQTFDQPVVIVEGPRGAAVIGGGYVAWYDGVQTFELGFNGPPFIASLAGTASGTDPAAGTYTYSGVWEYLDAVGVMHRSVPGPGRDITTASPQNIQVTALSMPGSRHPIDMTCQLFRAGSDAIARRLNRSNHVYPNTASRTLATVLDNLAASLLIVPIYTTGGVLEAATAEGAQVLLLVRERLWMGHFYQSDRLQFSKLVVPGAAGETTFAPEFFEAFARLMERGERITGLSSLDGATVVFTNAAIYLVGGSGPDARGLGDDLSRLTRIPTDAGCINFRSVVAYPDGVLYQSERGIYQLNRKHQISFIGDPARRLTALWPKITSALLVPNEQEVRWTAVDKETGTTDGGQIVYDYRLGAWFQRTVRRAAGSVVFPLAGATIIDGVYYISESNGQLWFEDTATHLDDVTRFVPIVIETGEIQPAGPQQHIRLGQLMALGEKRDNCSVTLSIAYDYNSTITPVRTWNNADLSALSDPADRMQLQRRVEQRCQSFRIRLETASDGAQTTGEGVVWHVLTCELGLYGKLGRVEKEARS